MHENRVKHVLNNMQIEKAAYMQKEPRAIRLVVDPTKKLMAFVKLVIVILGPATEYAFLKRVSIVCVKSV